MKTNIVTLYFMKEVGMSGIEKRIERSQRTNVAKLKVIIDFPTYKYLDVITAALFKTW